jgi:hypothetical protein
MSTEPLFNPGERVWLWLPNEHLVRRVRVTGTVREAVITGGLPGVKIDFDAPYLVEMECLASPSEVHRE